MRGGDMGGHRLGHPRRHRHEQVTAGGTAARAGERRLVGKGGPEGGRGRLHHGHRLKRRVGHRLRLIEPPGECGAKPAEDRLVPPRQAAGQRPQIGDVVEDGGERVWLGIGHGRDLWLGA
ncbi:hypothetical protein P7L75_03375 (plasmid) [Tistrella mobilis]|uniref:hypothetical protein n=1 Tax=Tistrella mobilis TaxID=171437 RepID=UPI0035572994